MTVLSVKVMKNRRN